MRGASLRFQQAVSEREEQVSRHAQYDDCHQVAADWLALMRDRLQICADVCGDKHSISNKYERVEVREYSPPAFVLLLKSLLRRIVT